MEVYIQNHLPINLPETFIVKTYPKIKVNWVKTLVSYTRVRLGNVSKINTVVLEGFVVLFFSI